MDVIEMRRRVTESSVSDLVERFYRRVQEDTALGPVFDRQIPAAAWPEHLARMKAFWSTVLRGTGRYRGDPMAAHRRVPGLERDHFDRWLAAFDDVLQEVFPAPVAAAVLARARRMGTNLTASLGL